MSFWKKLFGSSSSQPAAPPPASPPKPTATASQAPSERDNVGTRYETQESVSNFWMPYILARPKFPFLFFDFREKKDAMEAILSLPPIQIAADTGKLISTEVIQFGVYPHDRAGWGFFLAGDQITLALYDAAIASCQKHHGTSPRLGDPPKGPVTVTASAPQGPSSEVTFDWEEKVDMLAQMKARGITLTVIGGEDPSPQFATKRHYQASNKEAALTFLKANPVEQPHYYLVVHTPDGVFGRDKDGIYEQPD